MHQDFSRITPNWLNRAFIYNGSIGRPFHDFRYRLCQDAAAKTIHAAVYSSICYEKATDRQEKDFPWDESGVEEMKQWLEDWYLVFLQNGSCSA